MSPGRQGQQTEQHEWHREGGDSDRLFDLTGDWFQSVVALEITKEAQAAGGINSAHALAGEAVGEAGAAGQQASASSVRSRPSILDSFEYRRKCGWERGFPLGERILPWRERTTTAVPVWTLPANPKLTETLLLFTFAMMHLLQAVRPQVHEKHKPPPQTR